MWAFLKSFFSKPVSRVRISFSVSKKEAQRLHQKCVQLELESDAEVVRLALDKLFDDFHQRRPINCQHSEIAKAESVSYEFEAADEVVGALRVLISQLELRSSAEVIRVAINNFCES